MCFIRKTFSKPDLNIKWVPFKLKTLPKNCFPAVLKHRLIGVDPIFLLMELFNKLRQLFRIHILYRLVLWVLNNRTSAHYLHNASFALF
jgi:hypothetical protein